MLTIFLVVLIVSGLFAVPQPEPRVIVMIQVQQVASECRPLPTARVHKNGPVQALAEPDDQPGRAIDIVA